MKELGSLVALRCVLKLLSQLRSWGRRMVSWMNPTMTVLGGLVGWSLVGWMYPYRVSVSVPGIKPQLWSVELADIYPRNPFKMLEYLRPFLGEFGYQFIIISVAPFTQITMDGPASCFLLSYIRILQRFF
jgi:hypothetical protein